MHSYLVSYDLRKNRDYSRITGAIQSLQGHRMLESLWLVVAQYSATALRDHLLQYVDGDDGLVVVESAHVAAWRGVLCTNEWLKANV